MMDYLETYGGTRFDRAPVNDVDYLIFAQMAYLDFDLNIAPGTPLPEALSRAAWADSDQPSEARFAFQKKDDQQLIRLCASALRYQKIQFERFETLLDDEMETQFAALSLRMEDGSLLIAYRGTDNTLAGWKEDFNMAFMTVVSAQVSALIFLEEEQEKADSIVLIGHSKGGNLALYAAAACAPGIQDKLLDVVNFDGPGLNDVMIRSRGFLRIESKMRALLPRASLVGLLFQQPKNVRLVECTMFSLMQHYPYFWKTDGMDFIYAKEPTRASVLLGESVRSLILRLSPSEREQFVEAVYQIIRNTEAQTLTDMASRAGQSALAMLDALRKSPPESRKALIRALTVFLRTAASQLGLPIPGDRG